MERYKITQENNAKKQWRKEWKKNNDWNNKITNNRINDVTVPSQKNRENDRQKGNKTNE